jgi:hypothetical protein
LVDGSLAGVQWKSQAIFSMSYRYSQWCFFLGVQEEEEAKQAREEEARWTQLAEEERSNAAALRKVCTPDHV